VLVYISWNATSVWIQRLTSIAAHTIFDHHEFPADYTSVGLQCTEDANPAVSLSATGLLDCSIAFQEGKNFVVKLEPVLFELHEMSGVRDNNVFLGRRVG
jgi:hypothetical protein